MYYKLISTSKIKVLITFLFVFAIVDVYSQNQTKQQNRNQLLIDFGADFNFSQHQNYPSIDTNILKEIIDPSSKILYREKSHYLTFHLGGVYRFQIIHNLYFESGVLYHFKRYDRETNQERLSKYGSFFSPCQFPIHINTTYHLLNTPIIFGFVIKRLGISIGLNNWIISNQSTQSIYPNNKKYEYSETKYFRNLFDSLYFSDSHSYQFGFSYQFTLKSKPTLLYINFEKWIVNSIQLGLKYQII